MSDGYLIKPVDPLKIAALEPDDYDVLMQAVQLINEGIREIALPPALHTQAFHLMRTIGPRNLRNFDGMRIAALQIGRNRLLIERLRGNYSGALSYPALTMPRG